MSTQSTCLSQSVGRFDGACAGGAPAQADYGQRLTGGSPSLCDKGYYWVISGLVRFRDAPPAAQGRSSEATRPLPSNRTWTLPLVEQ
jgi:hypothetical protein